MKNFKKFYNTYRSRYDINDPDEELEPEIELAIMVNAGIFSVLELIIAFTSEDESTDPPNKTSNIINFERELKLRSKQIIKEQTITIAAQLKEINLLQDNKNNYTIEKTNNDLEVIPTEVGIEGKLISIDDYEKELSILEDIKSMIPNKRDRLNKIKRRINAKSQKIIKEKI